jgi:hypothetical protein
MHARSFSCRLSGACTALLALALLGAPAAAAKAASRSHAVRIAGTVSAVDTTAGTVTITPRQRHAGAVTLTTDGQTRLSLDGEPAKLADIPVGGAARAVYDSATKLARRIDVRSVPSVAAVAGKVTAVTASSLTIMPEEGAPVTLGTAASTVVILDGAPSSLSAIVVGYKARALYDTTTMIAIAIQAQSPHHELAEVEGQVTAVGGSSISIMPGERHGAAAVTLGTSSATQIFLDGAVSSLSAIAVGDRARALYDSSTMIAIVVAAEKPSGD